MTEIEILGSVYYSAYKVIKSDPGQITWIMKAKDKGIVQFYDNVLNETWTLIE